MFSRRLRGALSITFALVAPMLPALVPGTLAAQGLSLTTQFPSVTVTPGTQVSIDLSVDATEDATVALTLSGVPASWNAELHGGGYVVGAVFVDGNDPTTVRLDVDVPSGGGRWEQQEQEQGEPNRAHGRSLPESARRASPAPRWSSATPR